MKSSAASALAPETAPGIEWLNTPDAAKRLDRTTRTVLEMGRLGQIETREIRSQRGQMSKQFNGAQIDRIVQERERAAKTASVQRTPVERGTEIAQRTETLPSALASTPVSVPVAPRPWLTLEEASVFSGLTKRWLRILAQGTKDEKRFAGCTDVKIAIRDMGKGTRGGRWRFLRSDLEKG